MIRRLDQNGRIVIPMEIRTQLHWGNGDEIDLIVENREVRLKKVGSELCPLCGERPIFFTLNKEGAGVCKECAAKLVEKVGERNERKEE